MTLTKTIARNTLWQIIGKIIGTILGVIMIAVLTRYLGQEGFGRYATAVAFMQFFAVLIDFGLYLVCLREISAQPEKENFIVSNVFTIRFFSAIIFLGGGALLIFAFPYSADIKWSAVIVAVAFLFISLVQILTTVFQKYLKMGQVALAEVINRLGLLAVVVLFVVFKGHLPALLWSNVFGGLLYFVMLWWLIKKFVKIRWAFDFCYWKIIWKKAWPIGLGVALNLVYFRADTIILSLYRPAADVGIYSAPYRMLEILTTFPHMFMGLVTPILTTAWLAKNLDRFRSIMQKTLDFFMILIITMVLGAMPLAQQVMLLISGPEFIASGEILPILMLATALIFLGVLFTYTLVILEKQTAMLKYFFISAAVSLIGYFIFIPRYSYFGAAWVTVAIEGFIALTAIGLTRRHSGVRLSFKTMGKSLLSSLIMMAAIYLLPDWHVIIMILLAAVIYGLAMLAMRGVDKNLLKEIIKTKS